MSAHHLRKAAAIVLERGLARGMLVDSQDRVCALGALRIAHFGSHEVLAVAHTSIEYLADQFAVRRTVGGSATAWSDQPGRQAEEVAAAFEATADRLERG